jgi:hypothetical protein
VLTNEAGSTPSATDFLVILPPEIAGFSPRRGPVGYKVKIKGSELWAANSVTFDGIAAPFSVASDSLIEAHVPAGAETGPVVVTNAGGSTSAPSDFLVILPPSITSFTPASAPIGSPVRILGTGFTALKDVTFSGIPASFTVEADSVVRAEVPAGATTGPIAVMNAAASYTSASDLIVILPPAISSFSPPSGPVGTSLQILGAGFTGVTEVSLGGAQATSFSVDSDRLIRTAVPAGASTGPISVMNAAASGSSAHDFVVIVPPVVSSFTPTSGTINTEVTILGSGLTGTIAIEFGGTPVSFIDIDSDTRIRVRVPPGASPGPIRVTNAAGSTESAEWYTRTTRITVHPLEDASVKSSSAAKNFGQEPTLRCQTGDPATWLSFLKFAVPFSGTLESARLRLFVTNESDDGGSVASVSNEYFGTFVPWSEQELKFNNAPRISGEVLDAAGAVTRDTWVELDVTRAITGEGPYSFGIESLSPDRVVYSSAEGENPPELVLETIDSGPVVVSFHPASGAPGTSVTLTGMNFTGASGVRFGSATPASFGVVSDSVIVAEVPAGAQSGPIVVDAALGPGSSASGFLVIRVPLVTALTPAEGSEGDKVTISGSGFLGLTSVEFHGIASASFAVESDTEIRALVPSGASTGPIRVTNGAGSARSSRDFVVTPPPDVSTFPVIEDAHVSSSELNMSYGQLATIRVRSGSPTYNAYVKATVHGVTGLVRRAKLRLFAPGGCPDGGTVHLVSNDYLGTTTPWNEDGLTFLTAPAIDGPPLGSVGAVPPASWAEFEVTGAITSDGTYSFALRNASHSIRYSSSEGDHPPEIVLETLPLPVIASFSPSSASFGSEVLIMGSGLLSATRVEFGGTDAAAFTVDSDSRIRATVPEGAREGRIRVTTPFGSAESDDDFTPSAEPSVVIFPPSHDAHVKSTSPTRNYGTLESLRVRDGNPTYSVFLKFEVSGLIGQVTSARVRLRVTDGSDDGGEIYSVANSYLGTSTPWTQTDLVWENAPVLGGGPLAALDRISPDTWVEFDVTPAVTGDGTFSFAIRNASDNSAYFSSLEGTHSPELVVESVSSGDAYATGRTGEAVPERGEAAPSEFRLAQSRPNPARGEALLPFALPRPMWVELTIHNVLGQRIRTLVDGPQPAGFHEVRWDGRDDAGHRVASATYFYVLQAGEFRAHRKMVIQR